MPTVAEVVQGRIRGPVSEALSDADKKKIAKHAAREKECMTKIGDAVDLAMVAKELGERVKREFEYMAMDRYYDGPDSPEMKMRRVKRMVSSSLEKYVSEDKLPGLCEELVKLFME